MQIAMNPQILRSQETIEEIPVQAKPAYLRGQVYKGAKFDQIEDYLTKAPFEEDSVFENLVSVFKQATNKSLTKQQYDDNFKQTSSFIMFVVIGVLSIAYYLTFKKYHQSLVALDQLKEFLVNPNARVANRQQGEQILQIAEEEERKLSPPAETFETSPSQLLQNGPSISQQQELIKALIAQNAML